MIFPHTVSVEELERLLDSLARDISRLRECGPVSVREAQQLQSLLTRAQLALNELERVELSVNGIGRDTLERFADLEQRIRAIQDELYRDLRCRGGAGRGKESNAHDPAGR